MKKKSIGIVFLTFVMGILMVNTVYAENNIKVLYNGSALSFDVNPFIKDSRTLVPFRKILETLGASVSWDDGTQTVIAKNNTTQIKFKIGSKDAFVNGNKVALDVVPQINEGRTFVPLRFVSENLGAGVNWDGNTKSISISYPMKQVVISKVNSGGYEAVTVKKGIPVKLIFRVGEMDDINGCNGSVVIPKYQISKELSVGDNIVEFTPTADGQIPFSCGMGMIRSSINVVAN